MQYFARTVKGGDTMGYRIEYGPEMKTSEPEKRSSLRTWIAGALLLFSLVVRISWQEGTEILQSVLLPGDLSVTEIAFSEMMTDLRSGVTVADAVSVFCQRVIDGTY